MTVNEGKRNSHVAWVLRVCVEYPPELPRIRLHAWVIKECYDEAMRCLKRLEEKYGSGPPPRSAQELATDREERGRK